MLSWSLLLTLSACTPDPLPLPTEAAAAAVRDRTGDPPLYRKLYDYAFLPETQLAEQRVRLRIWLHYMAFDRYQIGLLEELAARTAREGAEVAERQRQIVTQHEPEVKAVYDDLWAAMDRGAPEAELATLGDRLDGTRTREAELLELRARSVRTLFDAQTTFLATLTPAQDAKFADAIWLLRNRLDPYANPGDFNTIVGPVYVAGQFGTLSRTTFDPNEDHLNIAGLWSEKPTELAGPHFPDARREVILYMVALEPALPEALAAEKVRAPEQTLPGGATPGVPAEPQPGQPGDPTPGQGQPPSPASPGEPAPAPAGEPTPGQPGEPPPGTPTPPAPAPPGSTEPAKPG